MAEESRVDEQIKYTRANFITRRLVDGFFGSAKSMLAGLEIGSALEVGCGEGFSTQRLRQMLPAGVQMSASDLDEGRVGSAAARNPGVLVGCESIYELSYADHSMDLVIVLEVLEHLDHPERAMAEICRVSRRWVLASVPREPIWRMMNLARGKYLARGGNTDGHVQHWSAGAFRRFVGAYGQVRQVRTPLPWTQILIELPASVR